MGLRADDSGLERMQQHQDRRAQELVQRLVEIFYNKKKTQHQRQIIPDDKPPQQTHANEKPRVTNNKPTTTTNPPLHQTSSDIPTPMKTLVSKTMRHQQQTHTNYKSFLTTNLLGQIHTNETPN